ncbi:MAG: nucleotidyltransferase domain-containing protein [Ignavibacteria bacterium]|nr:nucleotidyltransferase domain-containing protein [Ignavibacteria bacterium]
MSLKEKEIQIIKKFFRNKPVIKVYIFGSYARNEAEDSSDIDLLLELDYSEHIGLEFIGMQLDLQKMLKKKIDMVSSNGVSKYIIPYIDKDKQLIYERVH